MTLIMHVILIISVRAVSSNGIRIGLPRTLTMVSSAAILIVLLAIAQAPSTTRSASTIARRRSGTKSQKRR